LLRALDHANNGQLEWKVEQGPYLLSDGAIVTMREVVEVKCPDEDLYRRT
jgi:hypothetical protein